MDSNTMSIRLSAELKSRLDRLAEATDRSKSWLAADAIEKYLELQEWQIREITAGVKEADAGDFASDRQVDAAIRKWKRDAR